MSPKRLSLFDLLTAGVLLALSVRYVQPIPEVNEIFLGDETQYAVHGLKLRQTGQWSEWAPAYTLWYAALSFWTQDILQLYDLSFQALIVLFTLAFYGVLRFLRWHPAVAFTGSLIVLLSDLLFEAWPRVSLFTWTILLIAYQLWLRLRNSWFGWSILWSSVFFVTYARPEILFSFLLLVMGTLWQLRNHRQLFRQTLIYSSFFLLVMVAIWGLPRQPGRLVVAFGQHYAFRWRDEGQSWLYWERTVQRAFGFVPKSFLEVLWRRPDLVLRHVVANAMDVPIIFAKVTFSHAPLSPWSRLEGGLLALVTGVIFIYSLRIIWRHPQKRLLWWQDIWPIGTFLVPGLLSVLVIYPREHYFFHLTLPFWIAWWALLRQTHGHCLNHWVQPLWVSLCLTLLAWLMIPTVRARKPYWVETRNTIVALRTLATMYPLRSLGVPTGIWRNLQFYLPPVPQVYSVDTVEQARTLVDQERIDVLLLQGRIWYNRAPERQFLEEMERSGAVLFCSPRSTQILIVFFPVQELSPLHRCSF